MKQRINDIRPDFALMVLLGAMAVVATLGFQSLFDSWEFVTYAIAGALLALAVATLGRLIGLVKGETIAVSLVAFVLLGVVVTQASLSPSALSTFTQGLVSGWARALSALPPLDLSPDLRVLPFTTAWLGTAIGIELLRVRTPGVAVLGPLAALIVSMLMTYEEPVVAIAQGTAVLGGTLIVAFVQQRRRSQSVDNFDDPTIAGIPRLSGLLSAVAMLSVVSVGAWFLGPQLFLNDSNDRFDLREYQHPPFDPLKDPSPLTQVKAALQERNAEQVVFTVEADQPVERFPLAVLDVYNNEFWSVADPTSDAPAQFFPVDSQFPVPEDATLDGWSEVEATIEIVDLDQLSGGDFDSAWLPTLGWPRSYDADEAIDVRFNPQTGTVAIAPDGPTSGLRYELVSAVPPRMEDVSLQSATVTNDEPFNLAVPQLRNFASNVLEGADDGWEQVEAIRVALADQGAYDSREFSATGRPGHSLGRLAEFVNDAENLVGFEEQYAATAALVARSEGLPTRVVVGFVVPSDEAEDRWGGGRLEVEASDISAWIEVRFDGIGWLPFDLTPDRDRQPEDRPIGRSQRQVALPNPPTPPPPLADPPAAVPDTDLDPEEEDEPEDEPGSTGIELPVAAIIGISAFGVPFTVLAGVGGLILAAKSRRRRRRRNNPDPSRQIAGAWYEAVDYFSERGAGQPGYATPDEYARGLIEAQMVTPNKGEELKMLAKQSSHAAFHPQPATPEAAEAAWELSDKLVTAADENDGLLVRLKRRVNPAQLFRPDPVAGNGATK